MVRRRSGGAAPSHEGEDKRPAASSHGGRDKKKYERESSGGGVNLDASSFDRPRKRMARPQEYDSHGPGASVFLFSVNRSLVVFSR
jgi:hypothetical protein